LCGTKKGNIQNTFPQTFSNALVEVAKDLRRPDETVSYGMSGNAQLLEV
jgi:hypothetical protein